MFELSDTGVLSAAKIKVIGIGGAGGNAVNTMISYSLRGVDFIVANTDAQALGASASPIKIQLGTEVTKGWAPVRTRDRRQAHWKTGSRSGNNSRRRHGFITAGSAAGPARRRTDRGGDRPRAGALTVAVVTKPFQFEESAATARPRRESPNCERWWTPSSSYPTSGS